MRRKNLIIAPHDNEKLRKLCESNIVRSQIAYLKSNKSREILHDEHENIDVILCGDHDHRIGYETMYCEDLLDHIVEQFYFHTSIFVLLPDELVKFLLEKINDLKKKHGEGFVNVQIPQFDFLVERFDDPVFDKHFVFVPEEYDRGGRKAHRLKNFFGLSFEKIEMPDVRTIEAKTEDVKAVSSEAIHAAEETKDFSGFTAPELNFLIDYFEHENQQKYELAGLALAEKKKRNI